MHKSLCSYDIFCRSVFSKTFCRFRGSLLQIITLLTAMSAMVVNSVPIESKEKTTIVERDQPVCITDAQKLILENTWKKFENDVQAVGLLLFRRLFQLAPQAVGLFPKFRDVPIEELENNEDYRSHALQVVEAVGLAISFLDELGELEVVLGDLGSVHCNNMLKDEHFDLVGQSLIWTLEQGLGEDFVPDVRDAWSTFYAYVTFHMKAGLHKARSTSSV